MSQYDVNGVYEARITGQYITQTREGDPQVRIQVELTGKCKTKNPSDGVNKFDEIGESKTLYFNFSPNPDRLTRTFRDLRPLGLTSPDPGVFDLESKNPLNLTGKTVFVKPRYSEDNQGNQRDWWNLVQPMERAPKISAEALKMFKEHNASALLDSFNEASKPKTEKVPF